MRRFDVPPPIQTLATPGDQAAVSSEELLIEPRPCADDGQIDDLLLRGWGLSGEFAPLTGERDQNLRVAAADGQVYVLKIYNRMEVAPIRHFQQELLIRCASRAETAVPRLIPALDGGSEVGIDIAGQTHGAVLMSYLGGRPPLAQVGPGFRRSLGRAAGALALALADYDHPCARRELWWNHMALPELAGLTDLIEDQDHRRWITDHIALFQAEIAPRAQDLPKQVIHNDLNPSNIRVAADDPERIVGIIDFGDAVHAPRINELAVCCSYFMAPGADVAQSLADVVAGYESLVPLTGAEIDLLPHLICTRLATRILLTHWRYSRFPTQGDYIRRNLDNAWRTLEIVRSVDPAEIAMQIRDKQAKGAGA